ncbi:MAG: NADH-quinone oxidoreductase subunit A [Rikenellaceae bacterium]|jgi:NADH-quinone oxidoreductase subunit A|nr:NADH-quinone oxidoreductase subunit A [Rikenellaceae bacterium]
MTNAALFLVVLFTAVFLVLVALVIARFAAPSSQNILKGQPYECGIPTRGSSWMQFRVGYYLFAILYLIFDLETVLLFPWASVVEDVGIDALICGGTFIITLTLGLVYAWTKGALKWK